MNKKGDFVISVYWFLILIITAAGISYMAVLFYGAPYDVRKIESGILTEKIADCIAEGGYIKNGILNSDKSLNEEFKQNFLKKCNINFETPDLNEEKLQYYARVQFYKFNIERQGNLGEQISKISDGDVNLKTDYLLEHPTKGRAERNINMIVLHYSVTPTAKRTVEVLEQRGLSIHYVVDKDGSVVSSLNTESTALIDEGTEAWHAGCYDPNTKITWKSCRGSIPSIEEIPCCINVNPNSIGIEIVNFGSDCSLSSKCTDKTLVGDTYWENYPKEQIESLADVVADVAVKYNIPIDRKHILGHEEVSPGYKSDPGPLFPWDYFMTLVGEKAKEKIGGGREIYVLDKEGNSYVIKILTLINKEKKNEA